MLRIECLGAVNIVCLFVCLHVINIVMRYLVFVVCCCYYSSDRKMMAVNRHIMANKQKLIPVALHIIQTGQASISLRDMTETQLCCKDTNDEYMHSYEQGYYICKVYIH